MEQSGSPLVSMDDAALVATDGSDARAISCAAALFLEHGIANVKMTDIAEAAKVGVATLYRHFSTKTGIAVAAATLMWERFNQSIVTLVESDDFLAMCGADRLEALFGEYCATYVYHAGFVSFLDEFDHLLLAERPDDQALARYTEKVDSFYFVFEDAYLMGRQDGSIMRAVEFPVFYRAVAHALMGIATKLMRGEVIPSDDFSTTRGAAELQCIVDMAIRSLRVGA